MTQSEFDRQAEITRLLLEGISSTHVGDAAESSCCFQSRMAAPGERARALSLRALLPSV